MDAQLPYNMAYAVGTIKELSPPYLAGRHQIVNAVIDCEHLDGSKPFKPKMLEVKAWDGLADELQKFTPGQRVQAKVTVSSQRNKKDPSKWYHVVTLKEIIAL